MLNKVEIREVSWVSTEEQNSNYLMKELLYFKNSLILVSAKNVSHYWILNGIKKLKKNGNSCKDELWSLIKRHVWLSAHVTQGHIKADAYFITS